MDKRYLFQTFEPLISSWWQNSSESARKGNPLYTIIMPPPNVTGNLHLGHALSLNFQDILIRFHRMRGYEVKWMPGLDHASISTQMMVERKLTEETGKTRQDLGREAFLTHVWAWKEKHGAQIVDQMKRMGLSAQWEALAFTLDPSKVEAVNEAFYRLYEKGWIYRADRLVHWDPVLKTAVSDLEVASHEEKGTLWTLRYDLKDSTASIEVATTRPETIFGDVAIAVHPDDLRYHPLIGQKAKLPLGMQWLSIISDASVDPQKGTGAVKITPAHDPLDFEIGQRHGLSVINTFDEAGFLNGSVPLAFQGMSRQEARKKIIDALGDHVVRAEPIVHHVPKSERSGAVIEPRITRQWFIDMKVMAEKALKALDDGQMRFVPEEWTTLYREWLTHIQPWCVSRQLWWGHRIPVWYGPEETFFVARTEEEAKALATRHFGHCVSLVQEEDVLDTWFSAGLWPFAILGWPHATADFPSRYPTQVLVTGFDIIFFWVARMAMLGLEMTGSVPFHTVFIHPLIRDEAGKKMSKTQKNVIDPLDLIATHGADALRFALVSHPSGTRTLRFSLKHVEQSRNFITKLWNVARFLSLHGLFDSLEETSLQEVEWPVHQWLVWQYGVLIDQVNGHLTHYRFNEAALALHHFVWHVFCDWYVEFAKEGLNDPSWEKEIRRVAPAIFSGLLKLLHPFIPFVTEAIWKSMTGHFGLMDAHWPEFVCPEPPSAVHVAWLMEVIGVVRRVRSQFSIASSVPLKAYVFPVTPACADLLEIHRVFLQKNLGLKEILPFSPKENQFKQGVTFLLSGGEVVWIPLGEVIDLQEEAQRLSQLKAKITTEIHDLKERLSQEDFLTRAPGEVIENLEQRLQEKTALSDQIDHVLGALS